MCSDLVPFTFCHFTDAVPPSNIFATQATPTTLDINVVWTEPTTGATPTGYIIYYQGDNDEGSVIVNNGTTTTAVVRVTANPAKLVYNITMLTLSAMLPSPLGTSVFVRSE